PLAAPAHRDRLALERHRLAERRAGLGRQLFLETGREYELTGANNELAHHDSLGLNEDCGEANASEMSSEVEEHFSQRANSRTFCCARQRPICARFHGCISAFEPISLTAFQGEAGPGSQPGAASAQQARALPAIGSAPDWLKPPARFDGRQQTEIYAAGP